MEPTERDLLIRLDQKLTDLCKSNSEAHETFMGQLQNRESVCNTTKAECNSRFEDKVSVTVFRWTIGILVTIFLSIAGLLHGLKG